ncbi:MAG: hypothetical protein IJG15_08690 [Lachnospiraceae bacterium]|nr:hypothetical protein [Lachnospiraceae bacterium]
MPAAEESARAKTALKSAKNASVDRPAYEDMDAYLASLPMQEQLRRRIAQIRHRREEASEARRMQNHLNRAARYYETESDPAADATSAMTFSALSRALSRIPTEAQSTAPQEDEMVEPAQIEEEIAREREAKTRARIERSAPREAAPVEERKKERMNDKDPAPMASVEEDQQEPVEKQDQPLAEPERIPQEAESAQTPQEAGSEKSSRDTEPEQIYPDTEPAPAPHKAAAAAAMAASGHSPRTPVVRETASAEEEPDPAGTEAVESAVYAPGPGGTVEAETASTEEEPERAEEPAARKEDRAAATEQAEWIEQETRRRVQAALAEQAERARRQSRDQQIEDARLLKRYREDMPDQIDETLGRYGLSKDAAVRLGTLLLIVILSVIYVAGRGRQPAVDTTVPRAGEGATGAPAFQQTEEEGTGDDGVIPDAGGEVGDTGSGDQADQ